MNEGEYVTHRVLLAETDTASARRLWRSEGSLEMSPRIRTQTPCLLIRSLGGKRTYEWEEHSQVLIIISDKFKLCLFAGCQPQRKASYDLSPQDQTDCATLLLLLEHALESAHRHLVGMHWRVYLSSFADILASQGEKSELTDVA